MALGDTLKDYYKRLEDKYYSLMDYISDKGIPVYRVIDAIESRNIPSFPIFVLLCVLVLAGLAWAVTALLMPASLLTLAVQDEGGNPLAGAAITISAEGIESIVGETGADGMFIRPVPMGLELSVLVSKQGYDSETKSYTLESADEQRSITLYEEITHLSRTVRLMKPGTSELIDDSFSVSFSCSDSDYSETFYNSTGMFDLDDIPSDCGILYVTPSGGYATSTDSFNVESAKPYEIYLSAPDVDKGSVVAYVNDTQQNPLNGIEVALKTALGDELQRKTTLSSGSVTFSDVEPGRYYLTTYDPTGVFAEYDTSTYGDVKEVPEGGTSTFYVTLERRNIGTVKILVKNQASMLAVEDAIVTLSKGGSAIAPKKTDMEGKVEFDVGENVGYDVTVDHAEYLLEKKTAVFPSLDYTEVLVTKATVENSQSLTVKVVDEKGKPVESTRLKLKDAIDGKDAGSEIVTGVDGKGIFRRLQEGSYYVYAYKPGFGEKNSNVLEVTAREENSIQITLPIGAGGLLASVVDEKKQPLGGATIKVIDYYTGVQLDEQLTDTSGAKAFEVRADKTVYLEVSAPDYLPYRTIPVNMVKDVTQEAEVSLEKSVAKLEVSLEDITGSGPINGAVTEGQVYTAKLLLKVPENSTFDEVGVHFRTGAEEEGKTTTMESDYIYITEVEAAATTILRGTAYTPGTGFAIDSEHFTSGDAKWVNILFESPGEGIYEAVVKFRISEVAPKGELLDLHYRGWGKTGAYVRFPADTVLGSAEQTGTRQALYAQAKVQKLQVGATGFCMDNFCTVLTMEDLSENLESVIIDSYPANISANYRLSFDIVNESPAAYPNAELQITNEAGALQFIDYAVTDVGGTPRTGPAQGIEIVVPLGNMGKDDSTKGSVNFRTIKEGASDLVIAIVSEKQKIIEKRVRIETSAAAEMDIEVLPKMLVPYVKNVVMVNVDSPGTSPVPEATVTALLDGEIIAQGETDGLGVFSFELPAPSPGSVLAIQVEKEGFRGISLEMPISENILVSVPSSINELLVIGTNPSIDVPLTIKNTTAIPLTIMETRDDGDFPTYVTTAWDNDYSGDVLGVGEDKNMYVTFSLNGKGANLNSPKVLEGALSFVLANPVYGTAWAAEIPATIRIGFGDSVDDGECFHLQPLVWNIYTGTETKELNLVLKNSCAVDGEEVPLNRLEVKLLANAENELGTFEVSSNIENSATLGLTENYQVLVDGVEAGAEKTVTVKFKPGDIDTGSASPTIVFLATHMTSAGPEELKRELKVALNINNFIECIEFIRAENMKISSCPYNLGFSNYGASANYNPGYTNYQGTQNYWGGDNYSWIQPTGQTTYPSAGYGTGMPYAGAMGTIGGTAAGYPYTGASNYPYMPFYQSDVYNPGYNAAWQCGERKFTLRNNCESPVEIELDAADGLVVEESTFTIEPAEEKEVAVQPAYLAGLFNLDVSARVDGSKEKAQKLRSLQIVVENLLSRPYDECFTVEPDRVVDMSDIIQKPKNIKLINTCYNQGVRLLNEGGLSFGSGHEQIVDGVKFLESNFETDAAGGVIQVNKYEISPNYTYRYEEEQTAEFPREQGAIETLVGLRRFATANYYYVNHYVNAIVKYTSPQGSGASKTFSMILRDWWHLGAGASELMASRGHPDANPADCFDAGSVNICGIIGTIPTSLLATPYEFETDNAFEFTTDPKSTEVRCGAADKITRVDVGMLNAVLPEGMSISAEPIDNGHNIRFTLNAVEWYTKYRHMEGKSVTGKVKVAVTRANGKRATITTDVKICIDAKDTVKPEINAVKPSEEGFQDTELVLSIADKLPSSGLDKDTLKVNFGGERYTANSSELKYNETGFNSAKVTITPGKNFSAGSTVNVTAEIKDKAGNPGRKDWSYNVKAGVEATAGAGDGTATSLAEDNANVAKAQQAANNNREEANNNVKAAQAAGEVESCTTLDGTTKIGETGQNAYEKYGFHKLEYNWDTVDKDFCDVVEGDNTAGKFCDATQLTMTLVQKGQILEDFLRKLEENYCKNPQDCKEVKKDTTLLFREALAKVPVDNSCVGGANDKFFVSKDGGLIKAMELNEYTNYPNKNALDGLKKYTSGAISGDAALQAKIISTVLSSLGAGGMNPAYRDFVVVVNSAIGAEIAENFSGFKLTKQDELNNGYTMSFCDFQQLNLAVQDNADCKKNDGCTLKGKLITPADMKALYGNMEIVIGIRDAAGISAADKAKVIAQGKPRSLLSLKSETTGIEYASFGEFYNDVVEPEVYLMADGYGEGFVKDFKAEYLNEGTFKDFFKVLWEAANKPGVMDAADLPNKFRVIFTGNQWVYKVGSLPNPIAADPGIYKVTLNYDWSGLAYNDSSTPDVYDFMPGGSIVRHTYYKNKKPNIEVLVKDLENSQGIAWDKCTITVTGDKSENVQGELKIEKFSNSIRIGKLTFMPTVAFQEGEIVTVKVYLEDNAGKIKEKSWDFKIQTNTSEDTPIWRTIVDRAEKEFKAAEAELKKQATSAASGLDRENLKVTVSLNKKTAMKNIKKEYAENALFWMPIDGRLSNFNGYGSLIGSFGKEIPVARVTNRESTVLPSSGYYMYELPWSLTAKPFKKYGYNETPQQPQRILFVQIGSGSGDAQGSINYTLNRAVPIVVNASANSAKKVSLQYYFTDVKPGDTGETNALDKKYLTWLVNGNAVTATAKTAEQCCGTGNKGKANQDCVAVTLSSDTAAKMSTVAYLPIDNKGYWLELWCSSAGLSDAKAVNFGRVVKQVSAKDHAAIELKENNIGMAADQYYTLATFIEKITKHEVCIKPEGTGIAFYWNEAGLAKSS